MRSSTVNNPSGDKLKAVLTNRSERAHAFPGSYTLDELIVAPAKKTHTRLKPHPSRRIAAIPRSPGRASRAAANRHEADCRQPEAVRIEAPHPGAENESAPREGWWSEISRFWSRRAETAGDNQVLLPALPRRPLRPSSPCSRPLQSEDSSGAAEDVTIFSEVTLLSSFVMASLFWFAGP